MFIRAGQNAKKFCIVRLGGFLLVEVGSNKSWQLHCSILCSTNKFIIKEGRLNSWFGVEPRANLRYILIHKSQNIMATLNTVAYWVSIPKSHDPTWWQLQHKDARTLPWSSECQKWWPCKSDVPSWFYADFHDLACRNKYLMPTFSSYHLD